MTKILKRIAFVIFSFIAFVAYAVVGFYKPATLPVIVRAENVTYEETDVLDDLKGATIDGEVFDEKNYPADGRRETQILSFLEYGYSPTDETQKKYGLYLYVYNPGCYAYAQTHELNTIQMCTGSDAGIWKLYNISILDESEDKRFLKCRVNFLEVERKYVLSTLNTESRVYNVSSIELYRTEAINAEDYAIGRTFTFTGFSGVEENPLVCTSNRRETLALDVHSTFYRPAGNNGKNVYTQDSLHSVYFAVPKTVVDTYGAIQSLKARWRDAVLAPSLVTGNKDAYSAIKPFLGYKISPDGSNRNSDLEYSYVGCADNQDVPRDEKFAYNHQGSYFGDYEDYKQINRLFAMYYSGDKKDSADTYTVSTEEIIDELRKADFSYLNLDEVLIKPWFWGTYVNGKYAGEMFSFVNPEYTTATIEASDVLALENITLSKNFWDYMFGGNSVETSNAFDGIKAIYQVSDTDFAGTDVKQKCENLYIDINDYEDFHNFYKANQEDSYVYLLRYQVTDYIAQEATLWHWEGVNILLRPNSEMVDTNAYFFQQTINLDFNLIHVEFEDKNGVRTIIPVASDPVDVVPTPTPPMDTESDEKSWWDKYKWYIIGAIIGIPLLIGLVVFIVKKGIAMLFKGIWFVIKWIFIGIWLGIKYLFKGIWFVIKWTGIGIGKFFGWIGKGIAKIFKRG